MPYDKNRVEPMFPSSGMSGEDIGDALEQKPMLAMGPQHDNNPNGDQKAPPALGAFADGPAVIQNVGGGEKVDCCPGKPGCEPTTKGLEKY